MNATLQLTLQQLRASKAFNPRSWIDAKTSKFNEYMRRGGLSGCVVSVSGGVDSAVTAALMVEASRKADSPIRKILGIAQPIHSTASIQDRAGEAADKLGFDLVRVDQSELHTKLVGIVDAAVGVEGGAFAKGQLRSYMRTPVNYYIAQLVSQGGNPCVVMGTGNKDEDGYLRYFCKAGDGVVDVQLISDLHKSEVFAVGRELGVPDSILDAPPSADLWDGQTDEEELGFSYDFVELYTSYLEMDDQAKAAFKETLAADPAAWTYLNETGAKVDAIHHRNAHKAHFPVNL